MIDIKFKDLFADLKTCIADDENIETFCQEKFESSLIIYEGIDDLDDSYSRRFNNKPALEIDRSELEGLGLSSEHVIYKLIYRVTIFSLKRKDNKILGFELVEDLIDLLNKNLEKLIISLEFIDDIVKLDWVFSPLTKQNEFTCLANIELSQNKHINFINSKG